MSEIVSTKPQHLSLYEEIVHHSDPAVIRADPEGSAALMKRVSKLFRVVLLGPDEWRIIAEMAARDTTTWHTMSCLSRDFNATAWKTLRRLNIRCMEHSQVLRHDMAELRELHIRMLAASRRSESERLYHHPHEMLKHMEWLHQRITALPRLENLTVSCHIDNSRVVLPLVLRMVVHMTNLRTLTLQEGFVGYGYYHLDFRQLPEEDIPPFPDIRIPHLEDLTIDYPRKSLRWFNAYFVMFCAAFQHIRHLNYTNLSRFPDEDLFDIPRYVVHIDIMVILSGKTDALHIPVEFKVEILRILSEGGPFSSYGRIPTISGNMPGMIEIWDQHFPISFLQGIAHCPEYPKIYLKNIQKINRGSRGNEGGFNFPDESLQLCAILQREPHLRVVFPRALYRCIKEGCGDKFAELTERQISFM